jgi:hypothetical protein
MAYVLSGMLTVWLPWFVDVALITIAFVSGVTMQNQGFLPVERECPESVDVRIFLSGSKVCWQLNPESLYESC